MSKYIIDTDKYYLHEFDGALIVMMHEGKPVSVYESKDNLEELNSDYINENFGELQDEAYRKGFEDGKKSTEKGCEGCKYEHVDEGSDPCCICAKGYIDHYEPAPHSDRIEVGDIVDVYGNLGVVTYMYELKACVMMVEDGSSGNWNLNELKKTGKHFDIQSILEAMKS